MFFEALICSLYRLYAKVAVDMWEFLVESQQHSLEKALGSDLFREVFCAFFGSKERDAFGQWMRSHRLAD